MLAETIPESEFAQANSVLAKTALSFLQASRSFTAPVFCAALLPVGARNSSTSPQQRYLHPCLLIQLSRCSYSSANHPSGLLPGWEFTLRDCCAIMATIGILTSVVASLMVATSDFGLYGEYIKFILRLVIVERGLKNE